MTAIAAAIRQLTEACAPGSSITPEEVARAVDPLGWHSLLGQVRREAAALAQAGEIEILRKGKPVPADALRGVIRLRRRQGGPTGGDPAAA